MKRSATASGFWAHNHQTSMQTHTGNEPEAVLGSMATRCISTVPLVPFMQRAHFALHMCTEYVLNRPHLPFSFQALTRNTLRFRMLHTTSYSWAWQHKPVITSRGRRQWENQASNVSHGWIVSSWNPVFKTERILLSHRRVGSVVGDKGLFLIFPISYWVCMKLVYLWVPLCLDT